jgi:hypothetical protein
MDEEGEKWVAAAGLALFTAGFFIPWYTVTFSPPHGYAVVGDYNVLAGSYTTNGLHTGLYLGIGDTALRVCLIALVPITLSYFIPPLDGARGVVKVLHAFAHITVSAGVVALALLDLAFWNLGFRTEFTNQFGGIPSAVTASQYIHGHLGIGIFLLTAGLIVTAFVVIKQIGSVLGVLLIVCIAVWIIHSAWLIPIGHWIGF